MSTRKAQVLWRFGLAFIVIGMIACLPGDFMRITEQQMASSLSLWNSYGNITRFIGLVLLVYSRLAKRK
jgi:hypothetical protein